MLELIFEKGRPSNRAVLQAVYAKTPRAFGSAEQETAAMFADQAAVALANVRTYAASVELGNQLQEALVSRAAIEQAKGILMVRDAESKPWPNSPRWFCSIRVSSS